MEPESSDDEIKAWLRSLSDEEMGKLVASLGAFTNALTEHTQAKDGSRMDLAVGAKAWREIEAIHPAWRANANTFPFSSGDPENSPSTIDLNVARLEYQALRNKAKRFEDQLLTALRNSDVDFFRDLSEALKLPNEEIAVHLDVTGAVLLAWKELGGLSGSRPTKRQIRNWVEDRTKEGGELTLMSDRHWRRVWEDPFVAALLRG